MCSTIYLLALFASVTALGKSPPCSSQIYCHGKLLHTVQMSSVFPDSKTFVDMKMKMNEVETLKMFDEMMNRTHYQPTDLDVLTFVQDAFDPPGSEFQDWVPSDWVRSPRFLKNIWDPELKSWASDLNDLWKLLCRKMTDHVRDNPNRYSVYYVPNPVIVPGGRFREFYYWDSYWIIKGLLLSEMLDTVKGMLDNFISIVETIGFVPNGGRIYYSMRSQPPMLIPMVKAYLDVSHDFRYLKENIVTLEREFQFWITNRTITVKQGGREYLLARYAEDSSGPRPESYREDFISAQVLPSQEEKDDFYSELKSAAESGWDFSSRWFVTKEDYVGNLVDVKTKQIIPVDLNAIICWNARILYEFFTKLNMPEKADMYLKISENWKLAIRKVFWHEDVGSWLDYDIVNNKRREHFFPSNLVPLWTQCYDQFDSTLTRVLDYLESLDLDQYPGGIPASEFYSEEQWDLPNAWPPLQYMIIFGLDLTDDYWAKDYAYSLAVRWILSNYKVYNDTGKMYEKYDATVFGGHGGGGEYEVQLGFGWTNGIILELLNKYGSTISTATDNALFSKAFQELNSVPEVNPSINMYASSAIVSILSIPPISYLLKKLFYLFSCRLMRMA